MKRLISYYYYRIFKYFSKKDKAPIFSAFAVIIFFALLNLITLIDFVVAIGFGHKLTYPRLKGWNRLIIMGMILLLYFIISKFLKTSGFHEKALNAFGSETIAQKKKSRLMVISYFILTIGLLVLELYIRQQVRGF